MAADWIKVESVTPDKPELSVMADALGIDQDAVFGKLFRIWAWADQNIDIDSNDESNDDSVTVRVTKKLLDRVALCAGFADAMVSVGWLIESGEQLTLPNFRRHNGKSAKNRGVTAKRAAKFRDNSNGKSNGVSVTEPCKTALPREEIDKDQKKADATASAPAVPAKPKKAKSPPVTIATWLESLGDADAIPADDPVFDYADKTGIPHDFLALSWREFVIAHRAKPKRQADWPATYRNSVRGNWYRLWSFNAGTGECYLTPTGIQAQRDAA
jgi:hypothetical protein